MALKSLKITKAEREAEKKRYAKSDYAIGPSSDYDYGLRITLNERSLDKLGMTSLPRVGSKIRVLVECEVTEVSASSRESMKGSNEKTRRVELQIQKMDVKPGNAMDALEAGIAEADED